MRRSFYSLFILIIVGIGAIALTASFFSDTETSTGNILQAGELDLKIDNTSYYNGVLNEGTSWTSDNLPGHLFFNFLDLKPGDWGEDTISLEVQNNAWACMDILLTENNDVSCSEPEKTDDVSCDDPDGDPADGDLAQSLNFVFWADDGDNVFETDETVFKSGTALDLFNGQTWTLADSLLNIWDDTGPVPGGQTKYIGKFWCYGPLTQTPVTPGENSPTENSGFTCEGVGVNNAGQTDKVLTDVSFSAVQSRNNPGFLCGREGTPTPTPPTSPSVTPTPPTPTPQACTQSDVMLVLDRSGSISNSELNQLKTAANAFVTSLGLTPTGIHAGQSSFSTTGSLDQILTSNPASLNTSINALTNSGLTNLKSGIDLAYAELTGGNDRPDVSSPDAMIIVTDGQPNRPLPSSTADDVAAASADVARADGVDIFVVGVGGDVNTTYLTNEIADPGKYYSVGDYSGLQTILANLDLCEQ